MDSALGLVMTGGGARGAYQAGVLKRIGELKRVRTRGNPFSIIGGTSAGAINGSALAAGSHDFAASSETLAQLWAELKPSDVFRCDIVTQAQNSLTWGLHGRRQRALAAGCRAVAALPGGAPGLQPD